MELAIPAFAAGMLTILAPCVLPLLPVIVGGTVAGRRHRLTPVVITLSLAVSVIIFTLLIRASTVFIGVPQYVWAYISGSVIAVLGVVMLLPQLWERISARFNISSNKLLGKSARKQGWSGTILTGAALGPVFTSCSPTYAFILFSVLPRGKSEGIALLLVYVLGLAATLLFVAYLGQRYSAKLAKISDPRGWFKRSVAILFIVVGIAVFTGFDKKIEAWIIDSGVYNPIQNLEFNLTKDFDAR